MSQAVLSSVEVKYNILLIFYINFIISSVCKNIILFNLIQGSYTFGLTNFQGFPGAFRLKT